MFDAILNSPVPPKPTWTTRRRSLRHVQLMWVMVWRSGRMLVAMAIAARIARAIATLGLLYVPKLIIDQLVQARSSPAVHGQRIWILIGIEACLSLAIDLLGRGGSLCETLLGECFMNDSSELLMRHVATIDLEIFEDPGFFDSLERARTYCGNRVVILISLLALIQDGILIACLFTSLVVTAPWLIILLVIAVLPAFVGEQHLARMGYSNSYAHTGQRRVLDYLRYLGATVQTAKEIKTLRLGEHLAELYKSVAAVIYRGNKAVAMRRALIMSALTLVALASYYGAYVFLASKAISGILTLGTFTFLVGVFARARVSIERMSSSLNDLLEESLRLADFFKVLDMTPFDRGIRATLSFPTHLKDGFSFRDVTFCYPNSERRILDAVNFSIRPGEKVALIGENGAGKTTIVKLLLRLYEPTSGTILLDGIDLRSYSAESIQAHCSVLFQDFVKYDLSLRDNIGFGNLARRDDTHHLDMAVEKAGAQTLLRQLEGGYAQLLGRRFRGSTGLSGGEWQKVALARVHASDGSILICDEPTASLDAKAEDEIFERLYSVNEGRTTIIISHRFATTRKADKILVLSGGKVIEEGSHDQLIRVNGYYADLFRLQAAGYV
jgi:ATP-binding cassette, subfamily B, bacterial